MQSSRGFQRKAKYHDLRRSERIVKFKDQAPSTYRDDFIEDDDQFQMVIERSMRETHRKPKMEAADAN